MIPMTGTKMTNVSMLRLMMAMVVVMVMVMMLAVAEGSCPRAMKGNRTVAGDFRDCYDVFEDGPAVLEEIGIMRCN